MMAPLLIDLSNHAPLNMLVQILNVILFQTYDLKFFPFLCFNSSIVSSTTVVCGSSLDTSWYDLVALLVDTSWGDVATNFLLAYFCKE